MQSITSKNFKFAIPKSKLAIPKIIKKSSHIRMIEEKKVAPINSRIQYFSSTKISRKDIDHTSGRFPGNRKKLSELGEIFDSHF